MADYEIANAINKVAAALSNLNFTYVKSVEVQKRAIELAEKQFGLARKAFDLDENHESN